MGFFKKKSEPKNLFDFLELSIHELKDISYQLVKEDITTDGEPIKDYLGKLPKPVIKVFDHVNLRIFSDEFSINGDVQINAFFKIIDNELTANKMIYVTNQLYSFFGKDDSKEKDWTDADANMIADGYWTGRSFTLDINGTLLKEFKSGGYMITLYYDSENGADFELTILSLNSLL